MARQRTPAAPAAGAVVRLIDVAREAGVSAGAAACVLSGAGASTIRVGAESAARIRAVAERLGYQPNQAARSIRGKPSRTLAALTIHTAPAVESRRLLRLERLAWEAGYLLLVHRSWQHDAAAMRTFIGSLRARQIDGLLVMAKISARQYEGSNEEFSPIPAVFHGWSVCSPGDPAVLPDVSGGTALCVDHLAARGRRRIAAVFNRHSARADAWAEAMRRHGLEPDPALRYLHQASWEHIPSEEAASRVVDQMLIAKADAILAENDLWAAGLLRQLHRHGVRVPDDVALVGYNNLDLAPLLHPALTSVDEQDDLQAETMFAALMALIEGRAAGQTTIPARLVVRESA